MHPSCSVFRQALRLVTVAQYLQTSKGSAYEDDGCTYLTDYLKQRARGVDDDEESLSPALLSASHESEQCANVPEKQGSDWTRCAWRQCFVRHHGLSSCWGVAEGGLWSVSFCIYCQWSHWWMLQSVYCCMKLRWFDTPITGAASCSKTYWTNDYVKHSYCTSGSWQRPAYNKQVLKALSSWNFDFPTCHKVLYAVFKKYIRLCINQYASTLRTTAVQCKRGSIRS